MMTPLALEMLVWFATRAPEAGPFPNLKTHEPQKEIRNAFLADGIIEPWDDLSGEPIYRATDKGGAWLDMILSVPMPVPLWADPRKATGEQHDQWIDKIHLSGASLAIRELQPVEIPAGFVKADPVQSLGKLPPGFRHDTYVEVIYRDGQVNKPAKSGMRPSVGEAALFNWKQTGSDDDVIGYRFLEPPENKMAMPKAVA